MLTRSHTLNMATTTIFDLPRDVLVLILRAVLDSAEPPWARPSKFHENLRCVSRCVDGIIDGKRKEIWLRRLAKNKK